MTAGSASSRRRWRLCAVALAALTVACSGAPGAKTGASSANGGAIPPTPPGDLYSPPSPLRPAPTGTLIWAEKVDQPPLNPPATIWRILYHSRDRTDRDVAVSGFAIVPTAPSAGPQPVYAWAHGAMGQGDQCAPSRAIGNNLPPYGGEQVAAGAVLVATDYDGLGTPGEPTYLDGVAEGHAVLDSIRAAAALPGVGPLGPIVVAGESQGGGAALWAAQLRHSYAADLDLRGVVALAPAAQLPTIAASISTPPFDAYLGNVQLASAGLHASYGNDFDPSTYLTPTAQADLATVHGECADATVTRWRGHAASDALARDPMTVPAIAAVLTENSPGDTDPGVPILLAHGARDPQIPPAVTTQLRDRYCQLGATVTSRLYPDADHDTITDAAATDVQTWITDRYAGRPAASDC